MTLNKNKALLSLLLLVPVPSIGVLFGMILFPDTTLGKTVFMLSKLWLFSLPAVWYLIVDKGNFSFSPARKGGFGFGILSGLVVSGIILAGYFLVGRSLLDKAFMVEKMNDIGLASFPLYIGAALYWICINSVLEEYVWRWFVVQQCEALFKPIAAVLVSAVCFTMHHTIAMSTFMPAFPNAMCSLGIFIGGTLWSWMYVKYESIWPGYVSHAIVDLCVFGLGAAIIFW
jgi:membrane protease YdiL (CAAX protease family)